MCSNDIIAKMTQHFTDRRDDLSLDVLKFCLCRPINQIIFQDDLINGPDNIINFQDDITIEEHRDIVVYGTGIIASFMTNAFENKEINISAYINSNPTDETFKNKPVISISEYKEKYADLPIIIASEKYRDEISTILNQNGLNGITMSLKLFRIPEALPLCQKSGEVQYFSLPQLLDADVSDNEEIFVDCGALDGQSSIDFIEWCNNNGRTPKKIFAFEPDKNAIAKKIHVETEWYHQGVGEKSERLRFLNTVLLGSSKITDDGNIEIDVVSLDEVLADEKITFIKMDIEGSELAALKGAKNIIKTQKPKLAICVYHKFDDIEVIPAYIWSLVPEYDFYLRHHSNILSETVLYAVYKGKAL